MLPAKEVAERKRIFQRYYSSLDTEELQDLARLRRISAAKKGLVNRLVEYDSQPSQRQSLTLSKRTVKKADSDGEVTPSKRKKPVRSATPGKSAKKRQSVRGSLGKQGKSKASANESSTNHLVESAQKIVPDPTMPKLLHASIFASAILALGLVAKATHDFY